MTATLLQAIVAAPAEAGQKLPGAVEPDKPVDGTSAKKVLARTVEKGPKTPAEAPAAEWPQAGAAAVTLKQPSKSASAPVKAKGLPLRLNTAGEQTSKTATGGSFEARVLSRSAAQKAGVDGVLFTVEASDDNSEGTVGASLDYSSFAEAYGGGYGARLTLVELPACALEASGKSDCPAPTPVQTQNDTETRTLTAPAVTVRAGTPTILAAVADDEGETGDYKATPLAASSTWSTNLNTGDFSWSYGFPVPSVPGDMTPQVGLSYSSGTIDGRTGNSNNQSSWAGDGFEYWPGSIERRYKACADDGQKADDGVNKPGDLCWGYDNAFITFNGKGGELVPTGTKDEFKLQDDDGTLVTRLRSTNRGNGDNDGEYWRVTDPTGNRFYFGYNRLPGWADGKETTDSTWTVPVYGDDAGEDCHKSTFKDSWCQQAWRWNLDYAVDTHGNAIAYYYNQEKNSYGRNLEPKDNTRYVRGGYLDRIEYGLKSDSMYGTKALAKVDFTSSERCIPNTSTDCSSISEDSFYWYDTPWDMNCPEASDCDKGRLAPTFWTRKRLTEVTTQVLNGSGYAKVDSWKLGHRWGQADIDYQLLLDSIQRTGHTATTPVTLPKTTFAYTQLENRLDKTGDGYAPYVKARLSTIADEYGGQTDVGYSAPVCSHTSTPKPQTNTTRCFPQILGGSDTEPVETHWFNKYVVTSVTARDRTGGAPDAVTAYEYLGDAAWHFDDDEGLTKEKYKTWSQWRGYGHVRTKTGGEGGASAMKTQEDTYFLRGMDGDRTSKDKENTDTKKVTASLGEDEGDPITDHESAAGHAYKTVTFSGPGGKILHKTVDRPWHHETAKKKRDWGTITANFTGTSHTKSWTSLDNGAGQKWRTTVTATTYDTVAGRVTKIDDQGDTATTSDDQCTRTTYATNTESNILTLPSRVETVAVSCGTTPDRSKHVMADTRTAYDGLGYGAAPTKGDPTTVASIAGHNGTTATYQEAATTYDSYGRQLTATDISADVTATESGTPTRTIRKDGLTKTTSYTPATGIATTVTTTTPPARAGDAASAQTTTTTFDPLRGEPTSQKDTNGKTKNFTYDALGRADKIWLPDRKTGQTPHYDFDYRIEEGKIATVRTSTLDTDGKQAATYELYDGLLRPRQTQAPGPDGGRLLSDTFYDERGLKRVTFEPYYTVEASDGELFKPDEARSVESQMHHTYDGLNRETESRHIAGNAEPGKVLGTIETIHGGDRTTVIPPIGANATTTLTDARGRTTELRQHHSRNTSAGEYDTTTYTHTPAGELSKVTDPAGNQWTYTYDLRGNQTKKTDPDTGTTTSTYDARDRLLTTKDANGDTLYRVYDQLGRQTELRDGDATGNLRVSWLYDTIAGAKGQLTSSTRYVDGNAYTSRITQYDPLYRPLRTAIVIPAAEKALQGTYSASTQYKPNGAIAGVSYSAAGSLPGGSYAYTYDEVQRPIALLGDGFRTNTTYSHLGKPLISTYASTAAGSQKAQITNTYERGTQRLASSRVDRENAVGVDRSNTYSYDQAGNVLSIADTSRAGTDTQCFTYDHLRRLSEAWTEADTTCADQASQEVTGGVAPYWHSYAYDKTGNRTSETLHDLTGDSAKDTKRVYTYPVAGTAQPHTLTEVNEAGPHGTSRTSYAYDANGNTTERLIQGDRQKLTWDPEGHLSKIAQPVEGKPDDITEYLYDAEGNRLIERGPDRTTLTVGNTELVLPKNGSQPTATRYLDLGNGSQAVQTDNGKISFTIADHLGTGQLAITAETLDLSERRTLPFGGPRGNATDTWPGTKGYVGGTDNTDTTGLVHLGAREYDPTIGRFISADPIMDLSSPQQINGYSYSSNNPTTFSDPSGLLEQCADEACNIRYPVGGSKPKPKPKDDSSTPAPSPVGSNTPSIGDKILGFVNWFFTPAADREFCTVGGTCQRDTMGFLDQGKGIIHEFTMPDSQSWEECWNGEKLSSCGWALADLPGAKTAKGTAKALAKVLGRLQEIFSRCKKCFLAGTLILMAGGGSKAIEDVQTGDKVLATDPLTGESSPREVAATIITEDDRQFVAITVSTHSGEEEITATHEHPFWVEDEKKWLAADKLQHGMKLRTDHGDLVSVVAMRHYTEHATTYNLTVEGIHTYYVLAGETPILVHNSGGCPTGKAPEAPSIDVGNYRGRYQAYLHSNGMKRLPKDWDAHHAIPQEYRNHPEFGDFDFDAPSNMRGVPGSRMKSRGANVHQDITNQWKWFHDMNPNPSRAQIEDFAGQIDRGYGAYFWTGS
ncbi:polymorphic toxin-type HINT domain-containing protein [Streptomyces albidoflavus]|uniref:polymorphic toxin-type HINT domain-containing protein n=1 Tax=Streptomyces albidoflavus TaxID=1886 RepID=UPI00224D7162|nr:polymorphic toxin-type HINT domain-containing protein [Streptomyces albidoflavus]MCX4468532.1 polymorphic toxin-type HINT domain-containing protein [Streptomyces albidoflavus]